MEERSTDRLARIALRAAIFTVIALLCWYFRSVLVYIIAAFVVSLIGQPVIRALRKVRIKDDPGDTPFLATRRWTSSASPR